MIPPAGPHIARTLVDRRQGVDQRLQELAVSRLAGEILRVSGIPSASVVGCRWNGPPALMMARAT